MESIGLKVRGSDIKGLRGSIPQVNTPNYPGSTP